MFDALNRTRFLAELDMMLMRDRKGAIDDMLQVLREHGAIKQACASATMDNRLYREAMKRQSAVRIGDLLLDGVLEFSQKPASPSLTTLVGEAFFSSLGRAYTVLAAEIEEEMISHLLGAGTRLPKN